MLNIYHKNLILKKIINKNKDFIKYFLVGGLSALADFIVFAAFYYIIKNWFISGLISFCIATFLNYYLSIQFVFESGKRLRKSQEVFFFSFNLTLTYMPSMKTILTKSVSPFRISM